MHTLTHIHDFGRKSAFQIDYLARSNASSAAIHIESSAMITSALLCDGKKCSALQRCCYIEESSNRKNWCSNTQLYHSNLSLFVIFEQILFSLLSIDRKGKSGRKRYFALDLKRLSPYTAIGRHLICYNFTPIYENRLPSKWECQPLTNYYIIIIILPILVFLNLKNKRLFPEREIGKERKNSTHHFPVGLPSFLAGLLTQTM